MRRGAYAIVFLSVLVLVSGFQNCDKARFKTDDSTSTSSESPNDQSQNQDQDDDQPQNPPPTAEDVEFGLEGGHFDLFTAKRFYRFGDGSVSNHVHEFDDEYGVTYVDFFRMRDSDFDEIHEAVPSNREVYLIVANAQLSSGAYIEINGVPIRATVMQENIRKAMAEGKAPPYKFKLGNGPADLWSFKLLFRKDAIKMGGLIPTHPWCVIDNDAGRRGEYRNGALVLQAIDSAQFSLDAGTGTATWSAGLYWEAGAYWHEGWCYR